MEKELSTLSVINDYNLYATHIRERGKIL